MNRKQFILVLLALAIVGGAGLVLVQRSRQSWSTHEAKAGGKVLPDFPFNDVASIHIVPPFVPPSAIRNPPSEVPRSIGFSLVHTNGAWCIPERADYRANYDRIKDLLLKVRDLKVVESDTVGPSQLGRVLLEEPGLGPRSGLLVEFQNAQGGSLGSLLLGKKHAREQNPNEPLGIHGFFDGRYLLRPSEPHNVLLVPDELACAAPDPGAWLSQDFFKVENIKFISLVSPSPTNSWELTRSDEPAHWVLSGLKPDETLNPGTASDVAEILAFPRFVDVVPKSEAAALTSTKPTIVTLLTDYLAYTLKIWPKAPDGNYPIEVAVTGDVPEQRVPGPAETPEQKRELDAEYPAKRKQLLDKLGREQALASWVYEVDSWIEMVNRTRAQLLQHASPAATQSTPHAALLTYPAPQSSAAPPVSAATPPKSPPSPRPSRSLSAASPTAAPGRTTFPRSWAPPSPPRL